MPNEAAEEILIRAREIRDAIVDHPATPAPEAIALLQQAMAAAAPEAVAVILSAQAHAYQNASTMPEPRSWPTRRLRPPNRPRARGAGTVSDHSGVDRT